jgi:predicted RNA-binding protein YlxR (DUF448 family)/ribosomal protein L7Ae-like RNA K-turn-binding protein
MNAARNPDEGRPVDALPRLEKTSMRTCVGCGRTDAPDEMIRLVVSPEGEVAVDLAEGHFGRGAHLHASPACLAGAPRGLARSFRRPLAVKPDDLAAAIVGAADRRIRGLISSAARAGRVEVGADMAGQGFDKGKVRLIVVARDAAAGASTSPVRRAVAAGAAVAWGTKGELGALVGKSEVAVLGVTSEPIAAALCRVVRTASSVAENGKASEQRLGGARAAED